MAMLAERRKRTKYCLNPNGKRWSNDKNKFGQRMLEKMGWKEGSGLGALLQGIQEHVKISYKNDTKGLGCKNHGNEWITNQAKYESLLSSLSATHDPQVPCAEQPHGRNSLEERSKRSRARIRYQKFVLGKDVSRYSAKDMACILGIAGTNSIESESGMDEKDSVAALTDLACTPRLNGHFNAEHIAQEPVEIGCKMTHDSMNFENIETQQVIDLPEWKNMSHSEEMMQDSDSNKNRGFLPKVRKEKKKKRKEKNLDNGGLKQVQGVTCCNTDQNRKCVSSNKKEKKEIDNKNGEGSQCHNGIQEGWNVAVQNGESLQNIKKKKKKKKKEKEEIDNKYEGVTEFNDVIQESQNVADRNGESLQDIKKRKKKKPMKNSCGKGPQNNDGVQEGQSGLHYDNQNGESVLNIKKKNKKKNKNIDGEYEILQNNNDGIKESRDEAHLNLNKRRKSIANGNHVNKISVVVSVEKSQKRKANRDNEEMYEMEEDNVTSDSHICAQKKRKIFETADTSDTKSVQQQSDSSHETVYVKSSEETNINRFRARCLAINLFRTNNYLDEMCEDFKGSNWLSIKGYGGF